MTEPTGPLLGCIADDITGATDLAINLAQGGFRVVQVLEIPNADQIRQLEADAVVVALKIRSVDPGEAIAQSTAALANLRAGGCLRYFYKYCSTFDSTPRGNIGPIAENLLKELSESQTIFCPAFPRNGRTVYQGHLFVQSQLLNECGMQNHPLNPMKDSNLKRLLAEQTTLPVGLVDFEAVNDGSGSVRSALKKLRESNTPLAITDCCHDEHLVNTAHGVVDLTLLTGGSGIARFLPEAYRQAGLIEKTDHIPAPPLLAGGSAILSGSCSQATNRQVEYMKSRCPSRALDTGELMEDSAKAMAELSDWIEKQNLTSPIMIYSTSPPETVKQLQTRWGVNAVASQVEDSLGELAKILVENNGVRKLVVAGGETSGAVANALGVKAIRIGPEICPGVPWTECSHPTHLALAFKSGNFGSDDFFEAALKQLPLLLA